MERIQLDEVKRNFNDVLLLVQNGKQRVVIVEQGRGRAAFISLEDLALLENLDGEKEVTVERVAAAEVKRHLTQDVALVADRVERIIVHKDGVDLVALVPERDLALLENLDARIEINAAARLLKKKIRRTE